MKFVKQPEMNELIKALMKFLINNIFHTMKISKEGVDMCINVIWGALGFGVGE